MSFEGVEDIKRFGDNLEKASDPTEGISRSMFEGLKVDLLNRLDLATPVVTGNLRRGWTNGQGILNAAASIPTITTGKGYLATITNNAVAYNTIGLKGEPEYYARFVNDGHMQHQGQYVPTLERRLVAPSVKAVPFVDEATKDFYSDFAQAHSNLTQYLKVIVE